MPEGRNMKAPALVSSRMSKNGNGPFLFEFVCQNELEKCGFDLVKAFSLGGKISVEIE
jgi:hypothetical protein